MPKNVVHEAKRCLIDGFGVVLAGATVKGSAVVREYIKASGPQKEGRDDSWAGKDYRDGRPRGACERRERPRDGLRRHAAVDYARSGLRTAHASDCSRTGRVVGRRRTAQRSGRTFLEAFLTGFEVECKIAEAINPDHYLRGFHSTGTIGTFGAAASAAKLLKLSPTRCRTRSGSLRVCRVASA